METNKLITALRRMQVETGSLVCLGCGHEHGCSSHGCAILREAADRISELDDFDKSQSAKMLKTIAELRAALPVWISVEDRLPKPLEDVIVYYENGEIHFSWVDHDGNWTYDALYGSATHWMPLPGLPEREKSGGDT